MIYLFFIAFLKQALLVFLVFLTQFGKDFHFFITQNHFLN